MLKRRSTRAALSAATFCLLASLLPSTPLPAQNSNNSAVPAQAGTPQAQGQSGTGVKPPGMESAPRFRSRTELVLVPVLVQDNGGKHIPGLTKDKFTLEENGRTPQLGVFEEVQTTRAAADKALAMQPGHSNFFLGANTKDWRLTVVVLDMINTPVLQQAEAKKELIKYLAQALQRNEPTALLGLNHKGLTQLHSFTTDTQVLILALRKLQGEVTQSEMNLSEADSDENWVESIDNETMGMTAFMESEQLAAAFQQRDATRRTLAALREIANAYAAIPGRKTLIWASAGFPFMIDDPHSFRVMGVNNQFVNNGLDLVEEYEDTWRLLSSANIAVYPVDVMGLVNKDFAAGGGLSASQHAPALARQRQRRQGNIPYDREEERKSTLRAFADATGGKVCTNSNDLVRCVKEAEDDAEGYYLLGFYLTEDDRKVGWRKLKVKVNAPGAHVRAREGFYVGEEKPETAETRKKEIADAIGSPVEYTGVLINLRWLPQQAGADAGGKVACEYTAFVPKSSVTIDADSNAIDLTLLTVVLDKNNQAVADPIQTVSGSLKPEVLQQINAANGMALKQRVQLPRGSYQVRVLVRDNPTGRIGTVIVPLEVK